MWKAAIRPMMVDLPEPEGPTSAVTVPGLRMEADVVQHGLAGVVGKLDVLEAHFAMNAAERAVRSGSSSSGRSSRTSRVRSSPASASVICVPMPTT